MMEITAIDTGFFKLDGGAMFGVVPKVLWAKLNPPDENNLCTWAMRCLLVQHGDKKILIDTGMGDKQDEKFRSHFHPHGAASLLGSLADKGLAPEDITDVLLTHLHFDHVGGAVEKVGKNLQPTFPNAHYWTTATHWNAAMNPNSREKASFLKENFVPLQEAGLLRFINFGNSDETNWMGMRLRLLYGHTEAMMMPIIPHQGSHLVYCADLLPASYHIPMPYVMSYDLRPLKTLEEKHRLLEEALENGWHLFFEHDPVYATCTLQRDAKGRIVASDRKAVL